MKEFEWFEWFEWFGPSPIEPFNSGHDWEVRSRVGGQVQIHEGGRAGDVGNRGECREEPGDTAEADADSKVSPPGDQS